MSAPFWVRCIDAANSNDCLVKGIIYQAELSSDPKYLADYVLQGLVGIPWIPDRFEICSGKIVRCLDNTGSEAPKYLNCLHLYEVAGENGRNNSDYFLVGVTGSWLKTRFEDYSPATSQPATPAPVPAPIPVVEEKPFDFAKYYGVRK